MHDRCSASLPGWCWGVALLGLCGLACSGSGSDGLNTVEGKVLHKSQPVKGALVTFHPVGGKDDMNVIRPTGLTGEDGTFTLTTGPKEGAPAGQYVVTIICSEVPTKGKKGFSTGEMETRDRFGGAYANRATSRIKVEIKNGENKLEPFDLK